MIHQPLRRYGVWSVPIVILAVLIAGCSGIPETPEPDEDPTTTEVNRDLEPSTDGLPSVAEGNTAFAFDLYRSVQAEEGNLLFSPLSISYALAMTSAGARGTTLEQMEAVLHFDLTQDALHPAFNALELELASRVELPEADAGDGFALRLVNSLWAQDGHPFLEAFLDALGRNYGAGVRLVDYRADPEAAREAINAWVLEQTEEKIEELIPPGMVAADQKLTLVNAVYFLAPWDSPFEKALTSDAPFHPLDGEPVEVPTMHQVESFLYAAGDGFQAIEMPYNGGQLAMTIILPDAGRFADIEASVSPAFLDDVLGALAWEHVDLALPRFAFEWGLDLAETLFQMGMPDAFIPGTADFAGMDGTRDLFIGFVMHKAFISVFEEGTEAAAATAVGMRATGAPGTPVAFHADRPFLFAIRDRATETILFLGRLLDPS
jgi:serpin B